MTSAVPYDPDDFDNNPFSESSMIVSPNVPSMADALPPNPFASQEQQHEAQHEEQHEEPVHQQQQQQPLSQQHDVNTQTPLLTESRVANQQKIPNTLQPHSQPQRQQEDGEPQDESSIVFHTYPTEEDMKKFLPERYRAKSFGISMKVIEIEKNDNSSNGFKKPVIKFNATVRGIPGFRKKQYKSIRRTYRELEQFYNYLMYNNIEVFVPALPQIPILYNPGSPEFIFALINTFDEWFERICSNPILIRNQEFVLFFEQNDFSYTSSKTKPSNNSVIATGIKRRTLKQLQPPYDAAQYLAEYRPMIKQVHVCASNLLKVLERYIKYVRHSNLKTSEFYTKLSEFANIEINEDMGKLWLKFNKTLQLFNEIDLVKDLNFNATLTENFQSINDDTYNIKESLTNRHLLMRELINAEEVTRRRHATIAKLKTRSIIDPIKIDESIRALELAANYENELSNQIKRTTYNMIIEGQNYILYLTKLIKSVFKKLAQTQIQLERKKLQLIANNKIINPHESLSRLGREELIKSPKKKHVVMTENEDSWSSRPRKKFEDDNTNSNTIANNYKDYLNDTVNDGSSSSSFSTSAISKNSGMKEGSEDVMKVNAKSAADLLAGSTF